MGRYCIRSGNMYIHFNPHSKEYYVGDKKLGACVFDEVNGKGIIKDCLDDTWELCPIENVKVISHSKVDEKEVYNTLHS